MTSILVPLQILTIKCLLHVFIYFLLKQHEKINPNLENPRFRIKIPIAYSVLIPIPYSQVVNYQHNVTSIIII